MGRFWTIVLLAICISSSAQPLSQSELGFTSLRSARVNQPPTAGDNLAIILQNNPITLTLAGSDETLPFSFTTNSVLTNGSLVLNTNTGSMTYTPSNNALGGDFLSYIVHETDGSLTATGRLFVTILQTNSFSSNCVTISGSPSVPTIVNVNSTPQYSCIYDQSGNVLGCGIAFSTNAPASTNTQICFATALLCNVTTPTTNGTVTGSVGSNSLTVTNGGFIMTNKLNAFTIATNVVFADYAVTTGSTCSNLIVTGSLFYSFGSYGRSAERVWLNINGVETNISFKAPIAPADTSFPYSTNFLLTFPVSLNSTIPIRAWTSNYIGTAGAVSGPLSITFTNTIQ